MRAIGGIKDEVAAHAESVIFGGRGSGFRGVPVRAGRRRYGRCVTGGWFVLNVSGVLWTIGFFVYSWGFSFASLGSTKVLTGLFYVVTCFCGRFPVGCGRCNDTLLN